MESSNVGVILMMLALMMVGAATAQSPVGSPGAAPTKSPTASPAPKVSPAPTPTKAVTPPASSPAPTTKITPPASTPAPAPNTVRAYLIYHCHYWYYHLLDWIRSYIYVI
uniref:Uncharacterized protein n=1 Tax=Nelumbo nucifera TaxID=4432 RepID=A0A822XNP9_NELNU|nr:TPA_asm: hypothetical protein HUJ06_023493 [Nelumbo nucifera]